MPPDEIPSPSVAEFRPEEIVLKDVPKVPVSSPKREGDDVLDRAEVERLVSAARDANVVRPFRNKTVRESLAHLDLHGVDFGEAVLAGVNLDGCDVAGADFRHADLRGAKLDECLGLIPEQLAGADLTRALLPTGVAAFSQLENVKEVSKNAGALLLTTILACVFVLVTVVGTRDIQFLMNTGTAQLPVLNVSVATGVFFTASPLVLLALYATVQLYLRRLWSLMAALPAFFPDGVRLEEKTYPWVFNELIRNAFPRLHEGRPLVGFLQHGLIYLIVYGLAPLTVMGVWLRCVAWHDVRMSHIQAAEAFAAVGLLLWALAVHHRTMRRETKRPWSSWYSGLVLLAVGVPFVPYVWGIAAGIPTNPTTAQRGMLANLGLAPADFWFDRNGWTLKALTREPLRRAVGHVAEGEGRPKGSEDDPFVAPKKVDEVLCDFYGLPSPNWGGDVWVRMQEATGLFHAFTDIANDQSHRPEKWSGTPSFTSLLADRDLVPHPVVASDTYLRGLRDARKEFDRSLQRLAGDVPRISFAQGHETESRNLRFLRATRAFLVNADLSSCDLTGADLTSADLRLVTCTAWTGDKTPSRFGWSSVWLSFAQLAGADLSGARLPSGRFCGADLDRASLVSTDLAGASFFAANLRGAQMVGADLSGADLTRTSAEGASFDLALLPTAQFGEAILAGATFYGADLSSAQFGGADLGGARFFGAKLLGAGFEGADVTGADFEGSDPRHADFDGAFYQIQAPPRFRAALGLALEKPADYLSWMNTRYRTETVRLSLDGGAPSTYVVLHLLPYATGDAGAGARKVPVGKVAAARRAVKPRPVR